MRAPFLLLPALLLLAQTPAHADNLLAIDSVRTQSHVTCWAYGGSKLLESRAQSRDGVLGVVDIERGVHYWKLYERLWATYSSGEPFGQNIMQELGLPAEYMALLRDHGLPFNRTASAAREAGFAYPQEKPGLGFLGPPADGGHKGEAQILALQSELAQRKLSADAAKARILATLDAAFDEKPSEHTTWLGQAIPASEAYARLRGADLHDEVAPVGEFVYLSRDVGIDHPGTWFKYMQNRFWGMGFRDASELLAIARASIDRGWPTTLESLVHVVPLVGYKTVFENGKNTHYYAIAENTVYWRSEEVVAGWLTEVLAYYPAVADLLPKTPTPRERELYDIGIYPSVKVRLKE